MNVPSPPIASSPSVSLRKTALSSAMSGTRGASHSHSSPSATPATVTATATITASRTSFFMVGASSTGPGRAPSACVCHGSSPGGC